MPLVRIIKNWNQPNLMLQSPGNTGIWEDMAFTLEPVHECDYTIMLNGASEDTTVCCPPAHIWSIIQEPPSGWAKPWHTNPEYSFRTFTCDTEKIGKEYIHSQPALPWHINRDYDYLVSSEVPEKPRVLSWVTSNYCYYDGHYDRMRFMEKIWGKIDYDLFGRGFNPIEDKWKGIAPYRYSFAIENFSNAFYWSEKIADCFLAWTMPIYYGCTRITEYFPQEAMICIDINNQHVVEHIRAVLSEEPWHHHLDAIAYARELVLKKYQLFPFVTHYIRQFEGCYGSLGTKQEIFLTARSWNCSLLDPGAETSKKTSIREQIYATITHGITTLQQSLRPCIQSRKRK